MQIRSLIALAIVACTVAAPVRAQQGATDATAPSMQGPYTFGVRMAESLRAAGLAQPSGRVLLFVDSGGVQPRVSLQLSNVPAELHGVVLPLVNEYVATRGSAAPSHLSILLEAMVPRPPRDTAEVRSEQLPEIANASQVRAYLTNVAQTHPASTDGTVDVHATVRVYVNEAGQVVVAEARPTGDPHIDLHLTTIAHAMRFRPARINRRPAGVWIAIPLHFTPTR
ncbi:hypothetical protein [Longimicrobium sp.]|uniref:hypothetical protein n=1 Tax=Longimicrobium sp. TaxID=2029185 RepID=UPI003B3AB8DA